MYCIMLPKNLRYNNKVEASHARSYTSNIQPAGSMGPYLKGTTTTINIPTGPNLCLVCPESVLKFSVATVGPGDGRLDAGGGHGYIQRLRIFHGSNMLEDTDCYNLYAKECFDLQVSTDAAYGKMSVLAGTRNDLFVTTTVASQVNSGSLVTANIVNTYCLSLVSILGTLCSQNYFPLFACTSAPLRLEIQWVSSPQSAGCFLGTTLDFSVSNIEYIASYLQLSDVAMQTIKSSLDGPLSFTTQGLRNYQSTCRLETTSTQFNFAINAKFGSVKSIVVSVRDTARGVAIDGYFPHSTCRFGIDSYSFRIGSQSSIPTIAPTTVPQFFTELMKAVGSISDLNHQPSIDITSYNLSVPAINDAPAITAGSVNSGSFYVGLDLENYAVADKSTIFSGMNTKTDDIFCVMNFRAPTAAIASARFDAFVTFDQQIIFENNTCYTQF